MTLNEGQRVELAVDLRLAGSLALAGDPAPEAGEVAGFLALAAGTGGTVERVNAAEEPRQGPEVREYARLRSLLDDFGHQMPPASRKQLEEQVASLEPGWLAHQELRPRVTVSVRLDNGFFLGDVHEDVFTRA
ncbi:hypothetical protein OOK31_16160 [Streptomyces sp. NBC_00249]|uniref:hypothetical protein n=1 Tax=Streptomyces sp. NBC_00249 TaxID=2975690 RepID=UPI00225613CD|nr:hypothetical protein [Streptomyces sp. NBC_00249]MCX5195418.1 hypothetical protein [Streptomyces sp. NBC_00249]